MVRFSKIALIAAMAFYSSLVVFGNITDPLVNRTALEQVFMMKTIFSHSSIAYRAITNPVIVHLAFGFVVVLEALTALLCAIGAWKLFRVRYKEAKLFNQSKNWAVVGLTLGVLTWQVLFMSVGGEWFGMWMSSVYSGAITSAFHIFITMLLILIYVVSKDE